MQVHSKVKLLGEKINETERGDLRRNARWEGK